MKNVAKWQTTCKQSANCRKGATKMKAIIDPVTNRSRKVYESDEEKKAAQNLQYAKWRAKLADSPQKLEAYRARKNAASKKCIEKKKAAIAAMAQRLAELEPSSDS